MVFISNRIKLLDQNYHSLHTSRNCLSLSTARKCLSVYSRCYLINEERTIYLLEESLLKSKASFVLMTFTFQAGHLKLFRCDMQFFHKTSKHRVHQIFIFFMDLPIFLIVLGRLLIWIENFTEKFQVFISGKKIILNLILPNDFSSMKV